MLKTYKVCFTCIYDLDFLKANDNIKMSIDSDQFLEVLFSTNSG